MSHAWGEIVRGHVLVGLEGEDGAPVEPRVSRRDVQLEHAHATPLQQLGRQVLLQTSSVHRQNTN